MQVQLEKQRRQAMEKIAARKQRMEDRNYEDEMAVALIHAAEKSKTQKEEAAVEQKNKQNQLVSHLLISSQNSFSVSLTCIQDIIIKVHLLNLCIACHFNMYF